MRITADFTQQDQQPAAPPAPSEMAQQDQQGAAISPEQQQQQQEEEASMLAAPAPAPSDAATAEGNSMLAAPALANTTTTSQQQQQPDTSEASQKLWRSIQQRAKLLAAYQAEIKAQLLFEASCAAREPQGMAAVAAQVSEAVDNRQAQNTERQEASKVLLEGILQFHKVCCMLGNFLLHLPVACMSAGCLGCVLALLPWMSACV
jgi:hypothetical protein